MTGNGNCSASVPFGRIQPVIEQTDVLLAMGLHANSYVGSFYECPLEVMVYIAQVPP